jgi:DNA-binding GntR family transcriptional regulator
VPRVERRKLTDLAYDAVKGAILSGQLAMGERLVETRLAADLGMSRGPLREALQRLAKEGLVVERPHQGVIVAPLSAQDVADLYNVRLGLETVAVRLFVLRKGSTRELRQAIARMQRAVNSGDTETFVQADLDFHRHISQQSGNARLQRMFEDLQGPLQMIIALGDLHERLDAVAAAHAAIVDALERGDERQAVALSEAGIMSGVREFVAEMQEGDAGASQLQVLTPSTGT